MSIGKVNVENIVASASLAKTLDLKKIVKVLKDARYAPSEFPGLVYKLKEPKTAMLIFRSGKIVCTGAKNMVDVRLAINTVTKNLEKAKIPVYKNPKIDVQNIVAVYNLGFELNLNSIAITLGLENVEYEPEQFPGLVYRIAEPKVVMLLFGSGSVVCTGARDVKEIEIGVKKFTSELKNSGLIP